MMVLALLAVRPEHPLVPKLVRGLLAARAAGRWRNTQENAFALQAILSYAERFEALPPDLAAHAWVGQRPLLDAKLTHAAPSASAFLPMAQILPQGQPLSLVLQRQGRGRLYYRLGTEWAEADDVAPARDQGLSIERKVRGPEGPSTSLTAGEPVAFDLVLQNRAPLSYVAVEVPVPGGLEPVLEDLGQGHRASLLGGTYRGTSHEERLPDRIRLFYDHLGAGRHRVTLNLRATTVGEYALPPAQAVAMYMPEIYGRSTAGRVVVRAP
jgi:hypothetical protein